MGLNICPRCSRAVHSARAPNGSTVVLDALPKWATVLDGERPGTCRIERVYLLHLETCPDPSVARHRPGLNVNIRGRR